MSVVGGHTSVGRWGEKGAGVASEDEDVTITHTQRVRVDAQATVCSCTNQARTLLTMFGTSCTAFAAAQLQGAMTRVETCDRRLLSGTARARQGRSTIRSRDARAKREKKRECAQGDDMEFELTSRLRWRAPSRVITIFFFFFLCMKEDSGVRRTYFSWCYYHTDSTSALVFRAACLIITRDYIRTSPA